MNIEINQEMKRQQQYMDYVVDCMHDYRQQTGFARRFWMHTYGCQLNENDGEKIAGLLIEMGFIPAIDAREADLIILNTCSIRENAVDRLFGNLGQFKNLRRDKPDLLIAVCGCMMKQAENVSRIEKSYSFVDIVFGPQDIHRLPELLYNRMTQEKKQYYVGAEDNLVEGLPIHRARRFRALSSIMYGCNNFCTYCIVPYTRGRERSRLPDTILAELADLAAAGYREVMLLGQNVNSYGHDLQKAETADQSKQTTRVADFAELLEAASHIQGLYRIRFMTSHPKDISDKLLEVMAANPNIERHLHLPFQSGSNRILKRMNRQYTREQYLEHIRSARQLIPDLTISTDIIVGFPGETEEDFQQTLELMNDVRFDSAFTFLYSERPGTPAAQMTDRIDEQTMHDRFNRLVALQNEHSLASNMTCKGKTVEVLVEGSSIREDQVYSGRTSQNQLVNFTIPDPGLIPDSRRDSDGSFDGDRLEGGIARIHITDARTFSLKGYLEVWNG